MEWQENQVRMIYGLAAGSIAGGITANTRHPAAPAPPPGPLRETLAAIYEPPGPDGCRGCPGYRGAGLGTLTLCAYCAALEKLRGAPETTARQRALVPARARRTVSAIFVLVCLALFVLTLLGVLSW